MEPVAVPPTEADISTLLRGAVPDAGVGVSTTLRVGEAEGEGVGDAAAQLGATPFNIEVYGL
jgi:hypothetical protein